MANLNKALVMGRLTRDVELKVLPSGANVANLSIATNRTYNDAEGNAQEQVEYHEVVVFGKQAENCSKYLHKGDLALVEGRLQTRSWDKDGVTMKCTEIVADNVQFGPKTNTSAGETDAAAIAVHDVPF